uniref:FERM domain-containing protein n=1 Tax=Haemonchus contortus TaxID=6289 RepID=A0A7I4XVB4_HAECO
MSPKDPKMQAAKVRLLDGTYKDFSLHRGSDGEALFVLVSADLSIEEREYFSLCFYDTEGTRNWLYNDKKILRQLKGLPWEFCYEVKFYPTAPSSLNDDHARYNLFLQLRNDVCSGRLPATIETHATLGALVAQAQYGDAKATPEYEEYLRTTKFAPQNSEQLLQMIAQKHKEHKGLTPAEAENLYLDTCKQQTMYGIFVFNAKDSKGAPVGIGICAHGIYIYKDQIRVNRFPWQGIIKISYRKNQFAIKLKAGEIDKKEATVVYKVSDYAHAKRIWKTAVEHHTFFRLIQPDEKPKSSLFRWGSARFRYQGRTQFQTKMASQMFDKPSNVTVQRTSSARLTHSLDNVAKEQVGSDHVSPLHYADNELGSREPMASPAVTYEISGQSEKRKLDGKSSAQKPKKQKKGKKETDSSDSSSSSEDEKNQIQVIPVESGGVTLPHYVDPDEKDGRVVRRETNELKYRLKGEGISPNFDPQNPSLASTMAKAERLNLRSPRLEHAERTVTVRALAPLPLSYEESGQPHTTISTWQESSRLPDEVTTEYDEKGNKITRTLKTSQVKHTVQKQTFQNYVVPTDEQPGVVTVEHIREETTPLSAAAVATNGSAGSPHVVETHSRTVAYDAGQNEHHNEALGEFVSCKTLTSGNRTVETYTYKTERDGIIETHVEHRVTIHSDEPIDHDAELSHAIMEATQMNPDMTVEKIEVRQESTA